MYSIAVRRVHKALQYQYVSRKLKKRDMRSVGIVLMFGIASYGFTDIFIAGHFCRGSTLVSIGEGEGKGVAT